MSHIPVFHLTDLDDPRIADYRVMSDARLLEEKGLFVAESRLVVRRLLEDGRYRVRSLLVTEKGDGGIFSTEIETRKYPRPLFPPVFVVSHDLIRGLTGFNFHRGCLALADARVRIPMAPGVDSLNLATATGIALYELTKTDAEV